MSDTDKLVNAIIDMHHELSLFRKESSQRLEKLEGRMQESNVRLGKVENRLVLINKTIGELRLSNK